SRRRRHTRCYRDWSSDVCSSDLGVLQTRIVTPKDMPPWSMVSIPQSVPLEVVLDPRLKDTVTEQDIAGHWDLAMKANEDVEALQDRKSVGEGTRIVPERRRISIE